MSAKGKGNILEALRRRAWLSSVAVLGALVFVFLGGAPQCCFETPSHPAGVTATANCHPSRDSAPLHKSCDGQHHCALCAGGVRKSVLPTLILTMAAGLFPPWRIIHFVPFENATPFAEHERFSVSASPRAPPRFS